MPRAACAELIALCCAVCLLEVPRSIGRKNAILRGGGNMGTESDQMKGKQMEEYKICIPGTAVLGMLEKKHSTARHSTSAQGKARHRATPHDTARRCARLLRYIYMQLGRSGLGVHCDLTT